MSKPERFGGVIHTYQKYDPIGFPKPAAENPDLVGAAFDHMLFYGNTRRLTPEELARAVHIDPSQIQGLGPSLEALRAMLEERKRRILETYETRSVVQEADDVYRQAADGARIPKQFRDAYRRAIRERQIVDLERLWYRMGDDQSRGARDVMRVLEGLSDKYQIDELDSKYEFTGVTSLSIPEALEIKDELEQIDELLKQLEEATETAQIAVIDMEALSEFASEEDLENLGRMMEQVNEYLRQIAEQQGIEESQRGFELTPKAYRLFQSRLLEKIFADLSPSKSGRHMGNVIGDGAVELPQTKEYEFGDSVANMDMTQSMINALLRSGPGLPVRMKAEDIVVHKTRNNPKCATAVLLDMSGSMRHGGQYISTKRMALALQGLIFKEYPGDFLQFFEVYSFAKPRRHSEIAGLMPKPVTIYDPVVRLAADMSDPEITEMQIPPHFTNLQHGMQLARQHLQNQDTPNRQIILITDGLPTAHFEQETLYLLYPPDPRTEEATMREGLLCAREGIVVNIFLLPSWSQSSEDIQFAHRLAESTKGRVLFTAGHDLDRFVVWDYVSRRKEIIG